MKKLIPILLFCVLVGCVTKKASTITTNYDTAGNILTQREELVRVRGLLATSKTAGLVGLMSWTNRWATNESGILLTNTTATVWSLGIETTEFDVSDKAAETLKAGAKLIPKPGPL